MAMQGVSEGSGNIHYLQINKDGYFFLSAKEPTEGYELYESDKGHRSYRKLFYSISGHLIDIRFKDGDFGERFMLTLKDESGTYVIQMPKILGNSLNGYIHSFASYCEGITSDMNLRVACEKRPGTNGHVNKMFWISRITEGQDPTNFKEDVSLERIYSRKNQNVPEAKKVMKLDKETWDFAEVDNFYFGLVTKFKANYCPEQIVTDVAPVINTHPTPLENKPTLINNDAQEPADLPF